MRCRRMWTLPERSWRPLSRSFAEKSEDNGSTPDGNGGASSTPDDGRPGGGDPDTSVPQTGESSPGPLSLLF